jgi:hypothetical protein
VKPSARRLGERARADLALRGGSAK